MATPDEIALYEQTMGRVLTPAEMAVLDAETGGAPGPSPDPYAAFNAQAQPAPMQVPQAMSAPMAMPQGMDPAAASTWAEQSAAADEARNAELDALAGAAGGGWDANTQAAAMVPQAAPEPVAQPLANVGGDQPQESPFPRVTPEMLGLGAQRSPSGGGSGRSAARDAREARSDIEAARGAKGEALEGVQDAIGDTRSALLNTGIDRELAEQELEDQYAPKRDAAQEMYDAKMKEYEDANRAAAEIKPGDKRTTRQRIMGGIASALGSIAQIQAGLAGIQMENAIARSIEADIDRDIDEQRAELANARDTASAKRSEMSAAYEQIGDVRESEAVARQSLRDKYAATAQEVLGTLTDEREIAELEGGIQALNEKSAAEREALALRRQQLAAQAAARKRREDLAAAQSTLNAVKEYEQSQNLAGGLRVVDADRFGSLTAGAKNKQADVVGDVVEQVERSDNVINVIDRMQELRQGVAAGSIPYTRANEQLQSLSTQLTLGLKEAENLGALDQGALEVAAMVQGEVGTLDDLITGSAGDRLDAYRATVAGKQDRFLRGRGLALNPDTALKSTQRAVLEGKTRPLVE